MVLTGSGSVSFGFRHFISQGQAPDLDKETPRFEAKLRQCYRYNSKDYL